MREAIQSLCMSVCVFVCLVSASVSLSVFFFFFFCLSVSFPLFRRGSYSVSFFLSVYASVCLSPLSLVSASVSLSVFFVCLSHSLCFAEAGYSVSLHLCPPLRLFVSFPLSLCSSVPHYAPPPSPPHAHSHPPITQIYTNDMFALVETSYQKKILLSNTYEEPNIILSRGCPSGAVYAPCIYTHARWELQ